MNTVCSDIIYEKEVGSIAMKKENKLQTENKALQKFSNFVIFQTGTGKVNMDVFFQNETLWLTQKNMAELFEVNVPAISSRTV